MSLDDLLEIATKRSKIEFRERRVAFRDEAETIKAEMAGRGLLQSSLTASRLTKIVSHEYDVRALLAWQVASRVLTGEKLQVTPVIMKYLIDWVARALTDDCSDLEEELVFIDGLVGSETFGDLGTLRGAAIEKIGSEIEISLLEVSRVQAATGSPTVVNIYQPYGIVQTGASATAEWNQYQSSGNFEELRRALDSVESVVASEPGSISLSDRSNLIEVIDDVRNELSTSKPNMLRIQGALGGIASSIQTLGSATAAYQVLKAAAALVGVHLP
jgi:hypothetical protein